MKGFEAKSLNVKDVKMVGVDRKTRPFWVMVGEKTLSDISIYTRIFVKKTYVGNWEICGEKRDCDDEIEEETIEVFTENEAAVEAIQKIYSCIEKQKQF